MSIWRRLGRLFGGQPERKSSPYFFLRGDGNTPAYDDTNYVTLVRRAFEGNALVHAALMYKARAVGLTRLRAMMYDGEELRPLPRTHALARLLVRPNTRQSWVEFESLNTIYLNVAGNAYVYLDRTGRGTPGAMYPLRPDRVHVIPGERDVKGFLYVPPGKSWSDAVPILPDQIIHVKLPNALDDYEGQGYGRSTLLASWGSLSVDNRMTRFLDGFFSAGAMPTGVLKFDVSMTPEEVGAARARWRELYGGVDNWSDVAVLDNSGTYQRVGLSFDEMAFDSLDERSESRILSPLGVPAILLDTRISMKSSTYANKAEARRAFWEDTFQYELALWDNAYEFALTDERITVLRDYSAVPALQKNLTEQVDAARKMWEMGVPLNQALRRVGIEGDAIEGGDQAYIVGTARPVGTEPAPVMHTRGHQRKAGDDLLIDPALEQKKTQMWAERDALARRHEGSASEAAAAAFEADRRAMMALVQAAQQKAIETRASINWLRLVPEVATYFANNGENWRGVFVPVFEAVVESSGQYWSARTGLAFDVRKLTGEAWFQTYALRFSQPISQTSSDVVKGLLEEAQAEGWSIYEMQRRLTATFEQWMRGSLTPEDEAWTLARLPIHRAELIARTETTRIQGAGDQALFREWGIKKKEWLATRDGRTRPSHSAADGQERGVDEPFIVGGFPMMYPGDMSMGAPISEVADCRCTMVIPRSYEMSPSGADVAGAATHPVWDAEAWGAVNSANIKGADSRSHHTTLAQYYGQSAQDWASDLLFEEE